MKVKKSDAQEIRVDASCVELSKFAVDEEPGDVGVILPKALVNDGCFEIAKGVAVKWDNEVVVGVLE